MIKQFSDFSRSERYIFGTLVIVTVSAIAAIAVDAWRIIVPKQDMTGPSMFILVLAILTIGCLIMLIVHLEKERRKEKEEQTEKQARLKQDRAKSYPEILSRSEALLSSSQLEEDTSPQDQEDMSLYIEVPSSPIKITLELNGGKATIEAQDVDNAEEILEFVQHLRPQVSS